MGHERESTSSPVGGIGRARGVRVGTLWVARQGGEEVGLRTWLSSKVACHTRSGGRGSCLKSRVNGRGIVKRLASGAWGGDAAREGGIEGHGGGGCVGSTQHLRLVSVRVGSGGSRAHRWR